MSPMNTHILVRPTTRSEAQQIREHLFGADSSGAESNSGDSLVTDVGDAEWSETAASKLPEVTRLISGTGRAPWLRTARHG